MTKVLNRNQLKYIAILFMTLDHIAFCFPEETFAYTIMRFLGRLTLPTMAFFIAQGYEHTKNLKKYMLRLFIFALISWVPYVYLITGKTFPIQLVGTKIHILGLGVIGSLFLGLVSIYVVDNKKPHDIIKILIIVLLCYMSHTWDWGYYAILFCLTFYFLRNDRKKMWLCYIIICTLYIFNIDFIMLMNGNINIEFKIYKTGVLLLILFIELLYNNKPGIKNSFNKWFFYWYYPIHMVIIRFVYDMLK